MTLYYTLVFVILVLEMISFFLIVTPLPFNARRRLFSFISTSDWLAKTQYTLKITFVFILILFIDSVNRVYRVQGTAGQSSDAAKLISAGHDRTELQARKFYSQRNMYLCGFTLFLSVILNRTYVLAVDLLSAEDTIARLKAGSKSSSSDAAQEASATEIARLKSELKQKQTDLDTLKSQADGLANEYNKLGDQIAAGQPTTELKKSK
ncbi:B-cell receptor-associated protein 31-like-domain-containing protein [Lipomyces japonicus]|uniref:B-cell receptor-associated protein 31-like-domain-containing protein n=1 Tax=Lipomyces japonicus TaxID=56871 RepID=UPI0034CEF003